jgi:flagellar basal-body rod modification protein FlgD
MSDLAGWVGMEARSTAPANFDGDPVSLALDIPAAADSAELVVRNDQGQEVLRESIAVGLKSYEWDGHANTGQVPNGSYSFEVESRGNGELLSIDPVQSYSRVIEARRTADNVELVLAGGGAVDAGDVTGLRQPS